MVNTESSGSSTLLRYRVPCGSRAEERKTGLSSLRSTIAVRLDDSFDSPTPPPPSTITR